MLKNVNNTALTKISTNCSGRKQTGYLKYLPTYLNQRLLIFLGLASIVLFVPEGFQTALDAMSEAYLAVAVFVAGTLFLITAAEYYFKSDLGVWLEKNSALQVPTAAILGALPGCGGAIIAVTQFTRGYLSFGSVVTTLIATMGDAMFLFLAKDPFNALIVLSISILLGILTGYMVDHIHGVDFLRPKSKVTTKPPSLNNSVFRKQVLTLSSNFWIFLMIPGIIFGGMAAFQVDIDHYFDRHLGYPLAYWIGVTGATVSLFMWIASDNGQSGLAGETYPPETSKKAIVQTVIKTTNFVSAWVIFAFVGFEVFVVANGINLNNVFAVWLPLVPAIAILVGFIPGCGPQIIVTTLYLSGSIPLSAQIGNAIANDGDALFPAIAVAPKAALIATIYSAIPALIGAYSWYYLMETGF